MKTKVLRKFVVAAFAVATLCPLAQAQTMGGDDVKVVQYNQEKLVQTRMSVADNGWIYVMTHSGYDTGNSNVKIFRSKDQGATYQKLRDWDPSDDYQFQDFDIVVTGKNESDIKIWSVELMNKPGGYKSRVAVFSRDANAQNAKLVYKEDFSNVQLYDVDIASNYRSPSSLNNGGNPFALAFAYTGFNNTHKISFVDYVFSLNGGQDFNKNLLFSQAGEKKIDKVDLSLGSTSGSMGHNAWPLMGVVFEMNKQGGKSDIGFLSNFVDNDPEFQWSGPIKVSENDMSFDPKIQMLLDEDNNTINGESRHNFMITYSNYDSEYSDWDIRYVYPKKSFKYEKGKTPTMDDLVEAFLTASYQSETNSGLGYDKNANHYLITYAKKEENGTNTLKYRWANYDKIHNKDLWSDTFTYTSSANALYTPQVDINPTKGLVCWSWVEYLPGKRIVWSDTQWTHANGVEDIVMQEGSMKLYPNPAQEYAVISLPTAANCKAVVYDMQGRVVAEASFSGNEYRLNVQHLAKGTYMLKVVSDTERFVEKLIVE
ncbi:TapA/TapC family T9SS-dependent outer membrane protein [Porphyromonas gingivalis]|uniref:TapA/TapC family T9SS-dependent outer membrane protein n=1 Tax=Porphyromonas gingivalis TaxID=837 RepID=UPI000C19FFB7|nr:T9SS type A sorting domain-containing protein [Porphyromonas gingivalis]ATS04192.1 secretion protein [Porphyromonas gingivalis]